MKMTFEEVVASIKTEREHQDAKWGSLDVKQQSVAGYMLVLSAELAEACQLAAVAIACLQQHGIEENPL